MKAEIDKNQLKSLKKKLFAFADSIKDNSLELIHQCAEEEKKLLIRNIVDQTFAGSYQPHSTSYLKWKGEQSDAIEGFWRLWGSLIDAIIIVDDRASVSSTVTVDKSRMPDRTSSMIKDNTLTPIWLYAMYGEEGRNSIITKSGRKFGPQPARPIFGPTAEMYRQNYLEKQRNIALEKLKMMGR